MFRTMANAVMQCDKDSKKKLAQDAPVDMEPMGGATLDDIDRVTSTIIQRRLQKVEGLRLYLRRSRLACWPSAAGSVMSLDATAEGSEAMRSPITRLNAQQSLLMGTCAKGAWNHCSLSIE
jgi:hypothetical protein